MAANLDFGPPSLEDAPAINELINTAFRNTDPSDLYLPGKGNEVATIMDEDRVIASINDPSCVVLVVRDPVTGAIVGHGIVHNRDETRAWISMLAIDNAYRKRGVGGQIIAWAERYARREWAKPRMEFNVLSSRAPLIAWYKKRGYSLTGESSPFVYQYYGDWKGVLRDDLSFVNLGKDLVEAQA
ncbi:acetyltransferase [Poronia punctata]|nr:acetyltransferase [Poronia punctata]